jgi:hypothetical protein
VIVSRRRRLIRRCVSLAFGLKGYLDVWWTPELPIVYVNNPKSGCSTIKNSLKHAQAARYRNEGRTGFQHDTYPHRADDCLTRHGFADLKRGGPRLVISCVRNPYARALSGYLDKACRGDIGLYPEFRGERPASFEAFLTALTKHPLRRIDPHFCPQWINLALRQVRYDAVFYLENVAAIEKGVRYVVADFEIKTSIPHAQGARDKLQAFYSRRAIDLVQRIYADDFARLGYSLQLERSAEAPGEFWTPSAIVPLGHEAIVAPAGGLSSLNRVIRYRHLMEAGII